MTALDVLLPIAHWPGIYAVTCAPARLVYVGKTSRTMATRWQEHWALLKYGRHPNTAMQAAWKAYGQRSFDVAVIEVIVDLRRIDARERYWIGRIGSANVR